MTTPQPMGDPEDGVLDAFLTVADAELLDHVRAHINPARTLNALFDLAEAPEPIPPADYQQPSHTTTASVRRIRTHLHVRNLIRDLNRAHDRALDLNRIFDPIHARALVRDLNRALNRDLIRARDLDLNHDLNLNHARALNRALDRALNRALDRAQVLGLARDLAHTLHRARTRALDLDRDLSSTGKVDVSGADLSGLKLMDTDLDVLAGVVWDEATRWPEELRERIASSSEEVEKGVYQVRDGNEHDPYTATHR